MDRGKILSPHFFNLFIIVILGFLSVVSSDTDYHSHAREDYVYPHHHKKIHKNLDLPASSSQLDSLWKDVVKAAFASPMEWSQLSRALDKITEEEYGWKSHENFEPIHIVAGTAGIPLPLPSHPRRLFTYHKVYQTQKQGNSKSTSKDNKNERKVKANKIKQSAAVAIAAMSVSHETQPQSTRSLHNNNHSEIQRSSSPFPRTSLEREVIESMAAAAKHKDAVEDFHWRPWILHSSIGHGQNSFSRNINPENIMKKHGHEHSRNSHRHRKKQYDQLPFP